MADSKQTLQQALQYIKAGDKPAAIDSIKAVLQADKTNVDAWFVLANAIDDPAQQIKALQNALKIQPDYHRARVMLDNLQSQPTSTPSVSSARPSSKLDPRVEKAVTLIEGGFHRQAARVALDVIKDNQSNVDAWWVLANAVDDPERRIKALEHVVALYPDHPEAQQWLDELRIERDPDSFFSNITVDDDPFADVPDLDPFGEVVAPAEILAVATPADVDSPSRLFEVITFIILLVIGAGAYYVLSQQVGQPTNVLDVALGILIGNS
jgi:predicted Zn-dependent protease